MEDLVLISVSELKQMITEAVTAAVGNATSLPTSQANPNKRLSIKNVCTKYNISKPTLHKYMHKGLNYEKAGRRTLFHSNVVEVYFRSLGTKKT